MYMLLQEKNRLENRGDLQGGYRRNEKSPYPAEQV
jgi:hypothetical protein